MLPELATDAQQIIEAKGLTCERVVSVDRDSILYINACGKPRTAWLDYPDGGPLEVRIEPGFAATEPAGWHYHAH